MGQPMKPMTVTRAFGMVFHQALQDHTLTEDQFFTMIDNYATANGMAQVDSDALKAEVARPEMDGSSFYTCMKILMPVL